MDEISRRKMRAVGAIAVLVIAVLAIFFIFLQYKVKKNTALMLRMFYSDMTQTLQYTMTSNGPPGDWGWHGGYRNADLINNYLAGYLRVSQNCIKEPGKCMPDVKYKTLNNTFTNVNLSKLPAVKLQNGISFAIESIGSCKAKNSPCALLYVDLNNIEEPNMFGKDLFIFMIVNSNSVAFMPYNSSLPSNELSGNAKYGCNKKAQLPMYCSALIYANGWSIDKNYPW